MNIIIIYYIHSNNRNRNIKLNVGGLTREQVAKNL